MNLKKVIFSVVLSAFVGVGLNAAGLQFLNPNKVRTLNVNCEPYIKVENSSYFIIGETWKGDIAIPSGFAFDGFDPNVWTLSPFIGGKLLYCDNKTVKLFDPYTESEGADIYKSKEKHQISALTYSPDGTYILVFTIDNKFHKCVTNERVKEKELYATQLTSLPTKVLINKNADVALMMHADAVDVVNLETGAVRKGSPVFTQKVKDIDFAPDYKEFIVLLENGSMEIFNMDNKLSKKNSYRPVAGAQGVKYARKGKYAIINTGVAFQIMNLLKSDVEYVLNVDCDSVLNMDVFHDSFNKEQLLYIKENVASFFSLDTLEQYRLKEMEEKVAYELRLKREKGGDEINDEATLRAYALKIQYDYVTDIAGNKIGEGNATLGGYIKTNKTLQINFDNMSAIYVNIPEEDINDIGAIDDLEFSNTIYGLNRYDDFEVIYTKVRNKKTGKEYVFDNLKRATIAYDPKDRVPVEIIILANKEKARLKEQTERAMAEAKEQNFLSDHTRITVNTRVEDTETDADGNKILNYEVSYMYEVEEAFSEQDDFKPGKYVVSQSNAATQMMNIIEQSLKGDFAKYITDCKKIIVNVTGSADALPIRGRIRYAGEFGDYTNQPATQNGELTTMTVTQSNGIRSNEELAFIRAVGVSEQLSKSTLGQSTVPVEYKYNVEVSDEKGGAHRRIKVVLKFVDTFKTVFENE